MSAHQHLRAATAADHALVDDAFGSFDLDSRADYLAFLIAHARALPAVETVLGDRADLPALRPRTPLLAADLNTLGAFLPDPLPLPSPASQAEAFGMAYVIEGSRLGGGMLARRIAAGLPRAYLEDVHRAGEWRAFLRLFDEAAVDAAWLDRATRAARRVFALYTAAAGGRSTDVAAS